MKMLSKIFLKVPNSLIKDYIRQFIYNNFNRQEFKIYRKTNYWLVKYPNFELKFSNNPYHVLRTNYLFLKRFPSAPLDLIVDAGAYIGTFGLYVIKKLGLNVPCVFFEPDPQNSFQLEKNISLNGLTNSRVEKFGLWSKEAVLNFAVDMQLSSSLYKITDNNPVIQIPVNSLDYFFKEVKGKRIFVKMNVEGAELEALKGCTELLANNKVYMAISADHYVNGELTYPLVEDWCRNMCLSVTTIREEGKKYINVFVTNES